MTSVSLELLTPTRRALVKSIRNHGQGHIDSRANELFLSPSAVRQQLTALVAQGLLTVRPQRDGPGRPRHAYTLTAAGEALFPQAYDAIAELLLTAIEEQDVAVQQSVAHRVSELALGPGAGWMAGKSGPALVDTLVDRLAEFGYEPETATRGERTYVRLCHCPFRKLALRHPLICAAEADSMSAALGQGVRREAHLGAGDRYCEYSFPLAS